MSIEVGFQFSWYELKAGTYDYFPAGVAQPAYRRRTFTSNTGADYCRELSITAGQTVTLWEYGVNTNSLGSCTIEILDDSGTLDLAFLYDREATDGTASGLAATYNKRSMDWHMPYVISTRRGMTHATAATHVGAAFPSGEEAGSLFKVQAKNNGTATVRCRITGRN